MDANKLERNNTEHNGSFQDANGLEAGVETLQEYSNLVVDYNIIAFVTRLLERARNSSGKSLEDLIDLETERYATANPLSS